ncbi:hypothetical protein AGIG_G11520 [Arapaima gigas]
MCSPSLHFKMRMTVSSPLPTQVHRVLFLVVIVPLKPNCIFLLFLCPTLKTPGLFEQSSIGPPADGKVVQHCAGEIFFSTHIGRQNQSQTKPTVARPNVLPHFDLKLGLDV